MRVAGADIQPLRLAVDVEEMAELDLLLRVLEGTDVYVRVLTGTTLESEDSWQAIDWFLPLSAGDACKKTFRGLLRYVRWEVTSSGAATFSIRGMARPIRPFLPIDLSGALVWLRADEGVLKTSGSPGVPAKNGDTVQEWGDPIRGIAWTQGTAANRPTFNAADSDFGGCPSLSFDGTQTSLTLGSGALSSSATSYTAHFVVKSATADGTDRWLFEFQSGRLGWTWTQAFFGTQHSIQYNGTGYAFTTVTPTTAVQYLTVVVDAGNAQASCYVNGVLQQTISIAGGTSLGGAGAIGTTYNGVNFYSGKLAELVVTEGAQDASALAQLFSYTRSRYGIR